METGGKLVPGIDGGVYSYVEAGALLGVSNQRIRRWADGYTFKAAYGPRRSNPILQTARYRGVLSFVELVELMYVKAFLDHGVQLGRIRIVSERLAKDLATEFPFAQEKLFVEGRTLVRRVAGDLIEPGTGQLVALTTELLRPQLHFDSSTHFADAYTPAAHPRIHLIAGIRAGEPTVTNRRIPTRSVFHLWKAEGNLDTVAHYFEIPIEDIEAAIEFEQLLRSA